MILQQIIDYLCAHEVAGLHEIARAVDAPPDAVRGMLETLQRKGRVHPYRPPQGCGTNCRQCVHVEPGLYRIGTAPVTGAAVDGCVVERGPDAAP